jgi:hypothetical protein
MVLKAVQYVAVMHFVPKKNIELWYCELWILKSSIEWQFVGTPIQRHDNQLSDLLYEESAPFHIDSHQFHLQ